MDDITQEMIDLHILEWGVEMDGNLYMDGCNEAEDGCPICEAMDRLDSDVLIE
jgi:hypothetical protein